MDPLSGPESFLKQPWRSFISTLYRAMWPFCRLMSSAGLPMLASCRTRTSTIPSSIGFSTSLINTGTLSPCPEKRYVSISLTVNILTRFLRWEPFGRYVRSLRVILQRGYISNSVSFVMSTKQEITFSLVPGYANGRSILWPLYYISFEWSISIFFLHIFCL